MKQEDLTPPDLNQCQAERPNGHSFMTLGGRPGMERCKEKPVWIAKETNPGADGLTGSMSLCSHCRCMLVNQLGPDYCTFTSLERRQMGSLFFHNSDNEIAVLEDRPIFVTEDLGNAIKYHETHPDSWTHILGLERPMELCPWYEVQRLSTVHFQAPFLYSMFDRSVGEYPADQVDRFIEVLSTSGFDGAVFSDYAADHRYDIMNIIVFHPAGLMSVRTRHHHEA